MVVDEPVLEQLGEIAGKYRLDRWDGFDKSNNHVMDGNNFSLSVTLTDGKTISAHGSNCFSDGYSEVKQEICELFEDLINKYANREPETTEAFIETDTEHGKLLSGGRKRWSRWLGCQVHSFILATGYQH